MAVRMRWVKNSIHNRVRAGMNMRLGSTAHTAICHVPGGPGLQRLHQTPIARVIGTTPKPSGCAPMSAPSSVAHSRISVWLETSQGRSAAVTPSSASADHHAGGAVQQPHAHLAFQACNRARGDRSQRVK